MDLTALIVVILLVAFALIVVVRAVRVIQQGYVGAVKRLGQFNSVRNPGVVFLIPFVDSMELVDMRETPRTGDRQDVITRDNVSVTVNATIFSQVVDAQMALFSVSNYGIAVDQLSRTTLRAVFGGISLDEALSQREHINAQLQSQMESVTDKWGIRINRIEIVDILPPQQILNAMALQKQADQEKRAAILQSEGQQQSQINVAEGQKQAQIKTAEGVRQATILQAEGQRQAQILNAEGRAQAGRLPGRGRRASLRDRGGQDRRELGQWLGQRSQKPGSSKPSRHTEMPANPICLATPIFSASEARLSIQTMCSAPAWL